jgi:hypothetical protein
MRLYAIALALLLSTSAATTNLRGGRQLQWETVCDQISKDDWMAMAALIEGMTSADAEQLYEACVAVQLNNETRSEVFTTNCQGKTAVMVWKTFMTPASEGGTMECESELDCQGQGDVCFWKYQKSSCTHVPGDGMKPMCGSPKPSNNTDIAIGDP